MYGRNWKIMPLKDYASNLISESINENKPLMIARLGSTELTCMVNYLGVTNPKKYKSYMEYIKGRTAQWWWSDQIINQMHRYSGFFPAERTMVEKFCHLMEGCLGDVDILGSWLKQEAFFAEELNNAKKVMLEDLEPFFAREPWTMALAHKKVLVVHPFSETIKKQYQARESIFDKNFLPEFELKTIKAVQSLPGEKTKFDDWFAALQYMQDEIDKVDFDVCIMGCGAYGFPLASYVKKQGGKAIHLGGVTQMLFGIRGRRWDQYIVYPYGNLYNKYWTRPGAEETPVSAKAVEGACYW
jgi:hypothetical protein